MAAKKRTREEEERKGEHPLTSKRKLSLPSPSFNTSSVLSIFECQLVGANMGIVTEMSVSPDKKKETSVVIENLNNSEVKKKWALLSSPYTESKS